MKLSLNRNELVAYLSRQIETFYPDNDTNNISEQLHGVIDTVLERTEECFRKVKSKYFRDEIGVFFNHLNGDQYSMFLYLLSHQIWLTYSNENLASKIFLLNKMMFGVDAFYKITLPTHFLFIHPIGTVLGNATYGDYFVIYQNVTIGSKIDGVYPQLSGKNVIYSGASVIGGAKVGFGSTIGASALVVGNDVPENTTIVGHPGNLKIIRNNNPIIEHYFLVG